MSDLDVIDQRLRRVERHLGFVSAGTQAGHSTHPTNGGVPQPRAGIDTAADVAALYVRLDALAAAVEKLSGDPVVDSSPPNEHVQAPAVGVDNDPRRTTPKQATDDYGQPQA